MRPRRTPRLIQAFKEERWTTGYRENEKTLRKKKRAVSAETKRSKRDLTAGDVENCNSRQNSNDATS